MSESIPSTPSTSGVRTRRRDSGMTLPELLISITLMGLIVTVLASAITVTLRQQSSTEGRLNVARAEQSISLWMPADLSSADEVITDPAVSPCEAPVCPGGIDLSQGSNVVMMTWDLDLDVDGSGMRSNVSYHFSPAADGETYELSRIECIRPYTRNAADEVVLGGSWTCQSYVVLRDLTGPPAAADGSPVAFVPGLTSPTWVIRVSEPLAPDAIAGPDSDGPVADPSQWKDANRVIVTIDGGGATAGAGGGRNQISITAGGTSRNSIGATSMIGAPTFAAARSRCGGPITLVIDESQSIGTNLDTVRDSVREFVNTLRGTPVQVQIVTFTEFSRVLGAPGEWHKYFDMTDPAQADALYNAAADIRLGGAGGSGYTNWEEALYRVAYNPDGTFNTADLPHTLVLFTDGIPTRDRSNSRTAPWNAPNPVGYPTSADAIWPQLNPGSWSSYPYSTNYHQVAYNRAEWIAGVVRSKTKLIAVGVGAFGSTNTSPWRFGPTRPSVQKQNKDILADLITGDVIIEGTGGNVAPEAVFNTATGEYSNPDTARLYTGNDWSRLPAALRAVALGECAGTMTFQTRSAVPDAAGNYPHIDRAVTYVARTITNPDGSVGSEQNKTVETNVRSTAANFQLEVPSGQYVDVEFLPMYFTNLTSLGYSSNRWECTAAGVPIAGLPILPTENPSWVGFAVRVQANRAVSCTHYVNPPA